VPVTFHIPGALREFTAGRRTVELALSPATLTDALSALYALYPAFAIASSPNKARSANTFNLFVGDENIRYTGGLATPLPPTPKSPSSPRQRRLI